MQLKFQDKRKQEGYELLLEMEIIDTVFYSIYFISPTLYPNEYKQNWDSNIEWNNTVIILEVHQNF